MFIVKQGSPHSVGLGVDPSDQLAVTAVTSGVRPSPSQASAVECLSEGISIASLLMTSAGSPRVTPTPWARALPTTPEGAQR